MAVWTMRKQGLKNERNVEDGIKTKKTRKDVRGTGKPEGRTHKQKYIRDNRQTKKVRFIK
jgi:hypothetical protein